MDEFIKMRDLMDYINQNGGRSHDRIRELKDSGYLDNILESSKVIDDVKKLVIEFTNILDDKVLDTYVFTKKLKLYDNNLFLYFNAYGYELSAYFNNYNAYRNFPLFLKSACIKFGIDKYANMDIDKLDELLNNNIDLLHWYNPNRNEDEVEVMMKYYDNKEKYDNYFIKKNNNILDLFDIDDFYILAEDYTCIYEDSILKQYGLKSTWVAKDYGDGYGYDVLSYDPFTRREKVIEVKSGLSMNFTLTKNEYKTLNKACDNYSDYYVYKYYYDVTSKKLYFYIFKYDKDKEIFVDINNPNNICRIEPNMYFDKEKGKVIEFYGIYENLLEKEYKI